MTDPREALGAEIQKFQMDAGVESAFLELAYTAEEGGLIPVAIKGDITRTLFALVELAQKYKDGVPDELRM